MPIISQSSRRFLPQNYRFSSRVAAQRFKKLQSSFCMLIAEFQKKASFFKTARIQRNSKLFIVMNCNLSSITIY